MIAAAQPGRVASQREVARRLGVSHTALQKAQRAGRIAPEADGAWDVEKVRARLAESRDPVRKTAAFVAPLPPRPAVQPLMAPAATSAPDPLPRAAGSTFHDARTANEVLKAQERRLRLDERKGKLVDKARALLLVHRLAKEERDAILAWPARVAAERPSKSGWLSDAQPPSPPRQAAPSQPQSAPSRRPTSADAGQDASEPQAAGNRRPSRRS